MVSGFGLAWMRVLIRSKGYPTPYENQNIEIDGKMRTMITEVKGTIMEGQLRTQATVAAKAPDANGILPLVVPVAGLSFSDRPSI